MDEEKTRFMKLFVSTHLPLLALRVCIQGFLAFTDMSFLKYLQHLCMLCAEASKKLS